MGENVLTITLKRKLKVRIPLEVENCNGPSKEQHARDTSSEGGAKVGPGPPQVLLKGQRSQLTYE